MNLPATNIKSLSARLREETRAAHEQVEAALAPSLNQPTLKRYAKVLSQWHAFFVVWEPAVLEMTPQALQPWIAARSKIGWLESDLSDVGGADRSIQFPATALPIRSWPDVLGSLYVIEGSTLGGQILCKRFAESLSLRPDRGLRYFSSYGSETAARWRETKQLLDDPRWANQQTEVIAAANRTFEALTRFFST